MSKTDHARLPGTHRVGHEGRMWRKDDGESLAQRAVAARTAIAEGLTEHLSAPIDLDERFTVRECMDQFEALDQWHDGDDLRMADWEVALETGIEQDEAAALGIVWTTAGSWVGHENLRSLEREAEEDEAWDDAPVAFLAPVSTAELFDIFPTGGFVTEGPTAPESLGKSDAYLRVHELAVLVGIETSHMVEYLRLSGEWVQSHTSYVALPVCEVMVDLGLDLQAEYGKRAPKPLTWAQQLAEWQDRLAWREHRLTDECTYGCKVYRNERTGEERTEHSRVYGCPEGS